MMKTVLLALCLVLPLAAQEKARNVILFLGDAGGIPTLNAASILGHGEPRQLYIQSMPHVALSDTTSASSWVSDSAAGMTAIVAGEKTHNGVVSQSAEAVRGEKDGEPLKTILEYAEERGLSTGVVTNMNAADATPAACYAHVNSRSDFSQIFQQLLEPKFGDGVDVLIGTGLDRIGEALAEDGLDLKKMVEESAWTLYDSVDAIPTDKGHAIALFESREDFDLAEAVDRSITILSRNPKGFFLMVEGDMHTSDVRAGLRRALQLDDIIRETAERMEDDTLLMFTADHSFDLRIGGGGRGKPLLDESDEASYSEDRKSYQGPAVRMYNSHTGEEVVVAAEGPGAEGVRGFMANSDLFDVMMAAYGWKPDQPRPTQ